MTIRDISQYAMVAHDPTKAVACFIDPFYEEVMEVYKNYPDGLVRDHPDEDGGDKDG